MNLDYKDGYMRFYESASIYDQILERYLAGYKIKEDMLNMIFACEG